jgi:hypothetical protein
VVSELPSETVTLPRRTTGERRSSGELRVEKEMQGFAEDDIPTDDGWKVSSTSLVPFISRKAGHNTSTTTLQTSTFNHAPGPFTTTTAVLTGDSIGHRLFGASPEAGG